jgi:formate hydrogenlyase subunit 4
MPSMRERFAQLALVLLVIVLLLAPLFETIDRWDGFPQSGNDIVLTVLAALAVFGFVVLLRAVVVFTAVRLRTRLKPALSWRHTAAFSSAAHFWISAPPLPLRI